MSGLESPSREEDQASWLNTFNAPGAPVLVHTEVKELLHAPAEGSCEDGCVSLNPVSRRVCPESLANKTSSITQCLPQAARRVGAKGD